MARDDSYDTLRKSVEDHLECVAGSPVEVSAELLKECRASRQFGPLAFELYKEGGKLISLICTLRSGDELDRHGLDRNHAICSGLLVRISKLMISVVKLTADIEHGETVKILNRCIVESSVNLLYLLLKVDEDAVFDSFVLSSLQAEAKLYDFIQENIGNRGGKQLAIESWMISSIRDTLHRSGTNLDSARQRKGSWGGSFRDKLAALEMEDGYPALQMVPSHAVHGDWVDLLKEHLVPKGKGFEPNLDWTKTDGEMLGPVSIFAIEGGLQYLDEYFEGPVAEALEDRLEDLRSRMFKTEFARHDWEEID